MPSAMDRSDFDQIYEDSGPHVLTQVLRDRLGDSPRLDRELLRMSRSGKWTVFWNEETGEGCIVGRVQPCDPPG